ncbi:MAG: radical SAM protein [Nitrososphaeria archaeon]|nr:radical SAM protein [Nitrososphaeria archaeon]NIQ32293.1 radical SAM protein [Nitrososphaeria archaeon]
MLSKCVVCEEERLISKVLGVCVDCIRKRWESTESFVGLSHSTSRAAFGLPSQPPRTQGGIVCNNCLNQCQMGDGEEGYCGMRTNEGGRLSSLATLSQALAHIYLDPHVTNCCASYFCPAGTGAGYPRYACTDGPEFGYFNLAVFFYGCGFDCLFCQNYSHKKVTNSPKVSRDNLLATILSNAKISCICYFGGSPEPQLPYAIKTSEEVLKESKRTLRICWEWNGNGTKELVKKASELSLVSGGNVKFDLKTLSPELSVALSGVTNEGVYKNFEMVYQNYYQERSELPMLNATTLLVPGYIDAHEVEGIAKFISEIDSGIPYRLLIFHPDYKMRDLPVTPLRQVRDCLRVAKKHIKDVNLGNKHLLSLSNKHLNRL